MPSHYGKTKGVSKPRRREKTGHHNKPMVPPSQETTRGFLANRKVRKSGHRASELSRVRTEERLQKAHDNIKKKKKKKSRSSPLRRDHALI